MNEEKIIIRNSTEADVPRITEIYARSVIEEVASFELSPPGETEMALRRKGLTDQGMPHLVAEIDGKVIGYAYARLYRIPGQHMDARWRIRSISTLRPIVAALVANSPGRLSKSAQISVIAR